MFLKNSTIFLQVMLKIDIVLKTENRNRKHSYTKDSCQMHSNM